MSFKPLSLLWFLLVVPCIASFVLILNKQFQRRTPETYRLQVLSTRCALFLPVYSFFIFLSLVSPYLFMAYEVFIAVGEGYFFLVFFTLLIENIGGARSSVVKMEEAQRPIFLGCCCCTKDYNKFFKLVKDALLQFLFVRTIVVAAQAIATYAENNTGTKIAMFLSVISFLFVVRGFGSLVSFYENIMESSTNINGTYKLMLMKVSVGAIVIQGLIVELLWQTEAIRLDDTSDYTGQERLERIYCLLVLVEYCLMSVLSYIAFSAEITENSDRGLSTTNSIPADSLASFFFHVCNFIDISSTLNQSSDNMRETLVSKHGSSVV